MGTAARKLPEVAPARRVIMVTSNKGGTGKTTVGINLACAAATNGLRVAVLEFDTQRNFEHWAMRRQRYAALAQLDVYAGLIEQHEMLVKQTLSHDIVIIDTPPGTMFRPNDPFDARSRGFAALVGMSDFILVPTQPSILDLETTIPWLRAIDAEKSKFATNRVAFVVNRVKTSSKEMRDAWSVLVKNGRVCPTYIRDLTAIQRSMKTGHSIVDDLSDVPGKRDFMDAWVWLEREMGS